MKSALYIALIATSTMLSVSVYAIPPIPPTAPREVPPLIVCKDANELSEEEIGLLNAESSKIISFDQEIREICFKR